MKKVDTVLLRVVADTMDWNACDQDDLDLSEQIRQAAYELERLRNENARLRAAEGHLKQELAMRPQR